MASHGEYDPKKRFKKNINNQRKNKSFPIHFFNYFPYTSFHRIGRIHIYLFPRNYRIVIRYPSVVSLTVKVYGMTFTFQKTLFSNAFLYLANDCIERNTKSLLPFLKYRVIFRIRKWRLNNTINTGIKLFFSQAKKKILIEQAPRSLLVSKSLHPKQFPNSSLIESL